MSLKTYIKNIPGWRTTKKIVCFSVDDFGNVFLHSRQAREALRRQGIPIDQSRFSRLDILENEDDLNGLFEVLASVKDSKGKHACFTAFTMSANIDFDAIEKNNYSKYEYKSLSETFDSLPGYEKVWSLWKEGIRQGLLIPEFHGREHLNIHFLEEGMAKRDPIIMANLRNRSWAGLGYMGNIGFTEAFSFNHFEEVEKQHDIIRDGLSLFEKLFDRKARHFNAPGAREHHSLHQTIKEGGLTMIDADILKAEHQGERRYKNIYNPFGRKNEAGLITIFRNCIFEPSLPEKSDWVDSCLKEIEIAFRVGKPANITSHRVNFVGGIEPANRDFGLNELKRLLKTIIKKWPDVAFMSTPHLGKLI
jgi:hypothetical protein